MWFDGSQGKRMWEDARSRSIASVPVILRRQPKNPVAVEATLTKDKENLRST